MVENQNILVIDDEQVIIDAISRIATSEGLRVDSTNDAKSALIKLKEGNYSLILCDILLPEIDGFMFLDELLKMRKNIPVIMITGYSTVENAVKSIYKGAIDFVPKPFSFEELKSCIVRGLQFNNLQKSIEAKKNSRNGDLITFVPCPPHYSRLGNISWVNLESEGIALIGATNMYLETIKELKEIEMREVDEILVQGASCADFISGDELVHHFLSPVGGRIIERNEKLLNEIELLEKDPYFNGWIFKVIPSDIEYDIKYLTPCD